MKLYLVMAVRKEVEIESNPMIPNMVNNIPLIWAEGMCGAVPVFDNKEDANKYAGSDSSSRILEAEFTGEIKNAKL